MAGVLFDYDPISGVKEVFHKTDKGFAIQTVQDVSKVLEHNKRMLNEDSGNYRGGNYHLEAAIPWVVVEGWRKELGDDPLAKRNRKWLNAKLNDPDNKLFRTKGTTL